MICGSANFGDREACMLCQSKMSVQSTTASNGAETGATSDAKSEASSSKKSTSGSKASTAGLEPKTPHWYTDAIFLQWWKKRVMNFIGKDIVRGQQQQVLQQEYSNSTAKSKSKPAEVPGGSSSSSASPSVSVGNDTKVKGPQDIRLKLETSARYASSKDFYWRLDNFLEQRYNMRRRELILGGKKLDLHLLYKEVVSRGGYKKMDVEAKRKKGVWASVFRALPNYNENETSASYRLRKSYEKYLLEFELSEQGVALPRYTADSGYGRKKRKRDSAQKGSAREKGSPKGVGEKAPSEKSEVSRKGKPAGSPDGDTSGSQKEENRSDQSDASVSSATSSGSTAKKAKTS